MANLIQAIGFPLLFGSLWSILPVAVNLLLTIVRTRLEDRTLLEELNGYREYAGKVKSRLIPYVW
jgi:protein-S-isoprenylcysteine O-methyltransferase Ste14